jgi:hypothetical protein
MTTDPIQLLIDAGAIPQSPFASTSRYHGVALGAFLDGSGGPAVPYVLRRFIPQQRDLATAGRYVVKSAERPELVAARTLGDAELYWCLADANAVTDPFELTDSPGLSILIPLPRGL